MNSPGLSDRSTPLSQLTEEDFFTRDLDRALQEERIDIAVHSAKDVPEFPPAGLCVAALFPSFAAWECIVSRKNEALAKLPPSPSFRVTQQLVNAKGT